MTRLAASIAMTFLLSSGCASQPLRWDRADTADEVRGTDQAECRSRARFGLRGARQQDRERLLGRAQDEAVQPRNEEVSVSRRLQEEDHYRLAERLFVDCMEGKGYRRVPIGPTQSAMLLDRGRS